VCHCFHEAVAHNRPTQLSVESLWLNLALAFELLFGRLVAGASWERLAADYNILKGGMLPFLMLSPVIAGRMRGR
jgi:hypothetical protein